MFPNICGKNVLFHIFFTYYYHFLMKFTNVCVCLRFRRTGMLTVKVDPIFVFFFFPIYTRACVRGLCAIHVCNRPYVIYALDTHSIFYFRTLHFAFEQITKHAN